MCSRNEDREIRIGVLGGTFDPVHLGHLALARAAMREAGLDRVVLVPTGHSYFKDGRTDEVTPAPVRLRMTELAAEGIPGLSVSDIEVRRSGPTYTADTAEALKERYPGAKLFLIVGEDSVLEMNRWHEPERIFRCMSVLAAVRRTSPGNGGAAAGENPEAGDAGEALRRAIASLTETYGADIRVLSMPPENISSTEVRKRIAGGESVSGLVPEAVEQYIRENGLYGYSREYY